jgi:hypothetical protein
VSFGLLAAYQVVRMFLVGLSLPCPQDLLLLDAIGSLGTLLVKISASIVVKASHIVNIVNSQPRASATMCLVPHQHNSLRTLQIVVITNAQFSMFRSSQGPGSGRSALQSPFSKTILSGPYSHLLIGQCPIPNGNPHKHRNNL